jgi:hypothetical protein
MTRCRELHEGTLPCCRIAGHEGPHHWHSHLRLAPSYPYPHTFAAAGANLRCTIGAELDSVTS